MVADHGITPDMISGQVDVSQDVIDRTVETVRHMCGWHVWPTREESLTLDVRDRGELFIPTLHLVEVLDVEVGGSPLDLSKIDWSDTGIIVGPFPVGFRKVRVRVRHGFESAPDLLGVCLSMAQRYREPYGQLTVGGISMGSSSGITPQSAEWRIIDLYKLEPGP